MATVISMKALLESGVHFGHRTNKWHPHMRPYIFTERNGIHIIDLQQTVKSINTAYAVVRDSIAEGGSILFVGTKRQAQETIREEAVRCGMPYVTERWLGGMLTNWNTIYARIQELERLEKLRDTGAINRLTKKEGLLINREINRLLIRLSGVRNMKQLPTLIFVVDVMREETAVHEANLKEIPVLALVDTNCDPRGVDYVVPSNDDAIRAIKLLVGKIADAVLEGKAMRKDQDMDETEMAAVAMEARPAAPRPRMELEDELDDKDLLGESTLAKMSATQEPVAVRPVVPTQPEVMAELEAEVETVAEVEAEAEAVAETETEVEAVAEVAPEAEVETEPEAETKEEEAAE